MKLTAITVFLLTLVLSACEAAPVSYVANMYYGIGKAHYLNDMNDSGVVVGIDDFWAFKVENGVKTFLQTPGEYVYSTAWAINDSGIIVGAVADSYQFYKPCYWDVNGEMHLLPDYYGGGGKATAINSKNQIAGTLSSGHDGWATVWTDFTQRRILDYPYYKVTGINDQGQVIANNEVYGWGGMYWSETLKRFVMLARPSEYWFSSVKRINNRGQILGELYWDTTAYGHPAVWTDYNNPRILPGIRNAKGNVISGKAYDINDSGLVVGNVFLNPGDYYDSAIIWDDIGVYLLDDLVTAVFDGQTELSGVTFTDAFFINENNQILARGLYKGIYSNYFLLTPVPEPSGLFALACGLAGVGGMLKSRRKNRTKG